MTDQERPRGMAFPFRAPRRHNPVPISRCSGCDRLDLIERQEKDIAPGL
jgi:hypothetical protein